jgi:hypothetical protein
MTGYGDASYAASLAEFGTPRELPLAHGWLLIRDIPGSPHRDASGPYPLFCCDNWSRLGEDLDALAGQAVSVALVADPFGDYALEDLHTIFDVVVRFKEHYVVRCEAGGFRPSRHHRYYARRALQRMDVRVCEDPPRHIDEWMGLYSHLVARHALEGIHAFSREAFVIQLRTPGVVMFEAIHEGATVAAQLWYVSGDVAYSHLTACSPAGYALRASYALYSSAIDFLGSRALWLDLGAGPGIDRTRGDGLSDFKRGWASETRPAYFCGRILDADRYAALTDASRTTPNSFFPTYRTLSRQGA